MSDKVATYNMNIVNITTGNTVATIPVQLVNGENKIPVSLNEQSKEHGVYLLKLESDNGGKYNPSKLVIIR